MVAVRILKLLFCFKKPEVLNLSYLNVLVKDRPTLFIVWETKNALSVKLIPLKHRYSTSKNTLVLSIPGDQNRITFKVANFWRKKSMELLMHAVELDEPTTAQLINGFRPLNKLEVSAPLVSHINKKPAIRPFSIKQRNSVIKKIDWFSINIQPLNYP